MYKILRLSVKLFDLIFTISYNIFIKQNYKGVTTDNRNWQAYLQNQESQITKNHANDKRFKKFFKFTIPIVILEIIALVGLIAYFIILPKNICKVNANYKNAVVYINEDKTSKLRLKTPDQQQTYNFYEFDLYLEIKEEGTFNVTFTVNCDKYKVTPLTQASISNKVYTVTMQGHKKECLLTGIRIDSEEKISRFKVDIDVSITKV